MVDFLIYSSVKTVGVNYPWLKNRVLLFLGEKKNKSASLN